MLSVEMRLEFLFCLHPNTIAAHSRTRHFRIQRHKMVNNIFERINIMYDKRIPVVEMRLHAFSAFHSTILLLNFQILDLLKLGYC